jgi:hypothetical protein
LHGIVDVRAQVLGQRARDDVILAALAELAPAA